MSKDKGAVEAKARSSKVKVYMVGDGGTAKREVPASHAITEDPFKSLIGSGMLIEPPYNPTEMALMREGSSNLQQCVDAYATNIDGHGIRFLPLFDATKVDKGVVDQAQAELEQLEDWFDQVNPAASFATIRMQGRQDLETIGYTGLELMRDSETTRPSGLEHIPGHTIRLGMQDTKPTRVGLWYRDRKSGKWKQKFFWRYLRLYAQCVGARIVWFKSFGDPRKIDRNSGKVLGDTMTAADYKDTNLAHELIFLRIYSPRTPYGIPRWVGCSLGLAGSRAAEEMNLGSLNNNGVPPVAILTTAELDVATLAYLEEKFDQAATPGKRHRPIVIQAEPFGAGGDGDMTDGRQAAPKLEIKELTRPNEGMYQEYDEKNREKVQQAFRLPDILVGKSEHTFATASTALRMAEEQVFRPIRQDFDWMLNHLLMPELDANYWYAESRGPDLTSADDIAAIMNAAGPLGVGNPNAWTEVAERALGVDLPRHDDSWGHLPFRLVEAMLISGRAELYADEDGTIGIRMLAQPKPEAKPDGVGDGATAEPEADATDDPEADEGDGADDEEQQRAARGELVQLAQALRSSGVVLALRAAAPCPSAGA